MHTTWNNKIAHANCGSSCLVELWLICARCDSRVGLQSMAQHLLQHKQVANRLTCDVQGTIAEIDRFKRLLVPLLIADSKFGQPANMASAVCT